MGASTAACAATGGSALSVVAPVVSGVGEAASAEASAESGAGGAAAAYEDAQRLRDSVVSTTGAQRNFQVCGT